MSTALHDGRNLAADLAVATGEAASMKVDRPSEAYPAAPLPFERVEVTPSPGEDPTYYDQPVVKEPVWIATIPTYFFVGGLSGASAVLGMVTALAAPGRHRGLERATHLVGTIADALSASLLVADLGRPSRFLHMLRVFRPTSPMSIGSWVLTGSGASSAAALVLGHRPLGKVAAMLSGLLGGPLAGYTAVLLTNTAIPAWSGARRTLPMLFLASSAASAGSVLALLPLAPSSLRVARRFARLGNVAVLAASIAMDAELSRARGAASLRAGRESSRGGARPPLDLGSALLDFAHAASLASIALSFGTGRAMRRAADVASIAGAIALRFGIFHAGKASARDPRATFHAQRV